MFLSAVGSGCPLRCCVASVRVSQTERDWERAWGGGGGPLLTLSQPTIRQPVQLKAVRVQSVSFMSVFSSTRCGEVLICSSRLRCDLFLSTNVVALVIIVRYIDFTSGIGTLQLHIAGSWFIMFNCTNRNDRMNEISNLDYFKKQKRIFSRLNSCLGGRLHFYWEPKTVLMRIVYEAKPT